MVKVPPLVRPRAITPEIAESVKSVSPEPLDIESRRVVNVMCNVKPREESCELLVSIASQNTSLLDSRTESLVLPLLSI